MIIAIDGTSTDLSVALVEPDGTLVGDEAWSSEQRQSSELLPRLLALLDRRGRSLGEVTAVAVASGPGSFTGLRVAMALAKGIAFALGRPIVGVPSLPAWLEAELDALHSGEWTARRLLDELARAQWWTLSRLGASPLAEVPERVLGRLDTAMGLVVDRFTTLSPEQRGAVLDLDGETWTPRKVLRRLLWLEWSLGRAARHALTRNA